MFHCIHVLLQVDLFFYREPEEAKEQEEDALPGPEYAPEYSAALGGDWPAQIADGQWGADVAAPPVAAPAAVDWNEAQGLIIFPIDLFNFTFFAV